MGRKETFFFLGFVVLFLFAGSAYAYRSVIDLGTLGGGESRAYSINNNGQIVGESGSHACLFDSTGGGANKNLGGNYAAWSINNNGQIVGSAGSRACLFDPTGGGANTFLSDISESEAYSINNNGQIVGSAGSRACLFDPTGGGNNKDLGSLGGVHSRAYSINDNGQIVGYAWWLIIPSMSIPHACLFDPTGGGNNTDLGTLSGYNYSAAYCINGSNQIVGSAFRSSDYEYPRACFFDPTGGGNNTDLKTLSGYNYSTARCINDSGQIVGWAYNSSSSSRACFFDPTGHGNNIDLNTLINPSSGWTLQYAYSINNNGWIVGYGTNSVGDTHAYLLIPEPTSMLILGLGSVLIALRRRRKS